MIFNPKNQKYIKAFGIIVSILIALSLVLTLVPSFFY